MCPRGVIDAGSAIRDPHAHNGTAQLAVAWCSRRRIKAGLTRILLFGATTRTLRDRVAERFATRIRAYILDNLLTYPKEQIDVAVTAWIGAARNCVEQRLSGVIDGEPKELAAFVVRWNLRAVGIADAEIDAAIRVARRVVEAWAGVRVDE
ncbi:MAG: hypothetical protein ACT4P6_19240 [Gemmatimonadaceae bacterium]